MGERIFETLRAEIKGGSHDLGKPGRNQIRSQNGGVDKDGCMWDEWQVIYAVEHDRLYGHVRRAEANTKD